MRINLEPLEFRKKIKMACHFWFHLFSSQLIIESYWKFHPSTSQLHQAENN